MGGPGHVSQPPVDTGWTLSCLPSRRAHPSWLHQVQGSPTAAAGAPVTGQGPGSAPALPQPARPRFKTTSRGFWAFDPSSFRLTSLCPTLEGKRLLRSRRWTGREAATSPALCSQRSHGRPGSRCFLEPSGASARVCGACLSSVPSFQPVPGFLLPPRTPLRLMAQVGPSLLPLELSGPSQLPSGTLSSPPALTGLLWALGRDCPSQGQREQWLTRLCPTCVPSHTVCTRHRCHSPQ